MSNVYIIPNNIALSPPLHRERVCDRTNDCGDWEDEPKDVCGQRRDECKESNGGCDQVILFLPCP